MCGIFGYIGENTSDMKSSQAAKRVFFGLRELEYRGYDSWGIVSVPELQKGDRDPRALRMVRSVGKISESDTGNTSTLFGNISMGHTRWATHGSVSKKNAHPHMNEDKTIAVVHNGIIENANELRKLLRAKTFYSKKKIFQSDTDTEVLPHLIDSYVKEGKKFEDAVRSAARDISGNYAFAVARSGIPYVILVRNGSPLVVGRTKKETFFASDQFAFPKEVEDVFYMDDGELAILSHHADPHFTRIHDSRVIRKRKNRFESQKKAEEKGVWPHHMLKEIMEQEETILRALPTVSHVSERAGKEIVRATRVYLTACGTAGFVSQVAEYFFSTISKKETSFFPASEWKKVKNFLDKETLLIAVSQSGETADVLEAVREAKKRGVRVISLLNAPKTSLERLSSETFFIHAGREQAVASTKAATAQMALLLSLAYAGTSNHKSGLALLARSARAIKKYLHSEGEEKVRNVARKYAESTLLFLIGRGALAPIALEGALKIQEVSYMHAQGFPGGELKHGPLALIEDGTPCIVLVGNDESRGDMLSNAAELAARGAHIVGVSPQNEEIFDDWIPVPDVGHAQPIASVIPLQFLAYYFSVFRGLDPDKPRNLAKSVTVK